MADGRDETRDVASGEPARAPDPQRRTFLAIAATGACAVVAAGAVPAAAFVAAPAGAAGAGGLRFTVGNLADLRPGVPKKVAIVGDEVDAWTRAQNRKLGAVWVLRTGEREVRALAVTCPHLGCAIDAVTGDDGKATSFSCPCHDSSFTLTGERETGPSPRDMDPLPVEVGKDGEVVVTFKRYRIGVEAREEIG